MMDKPQSFELKLKPPKLRSVSKPSKYLWRFKSIYLCEWVLDLPPSFLLGSGPFPAQFKSPQTRLCGRGLVQQQHTQVQELLSKGWNALTQLVHLALGWHFHFPAQRALVLIAHHKIPVPCCRAQTVAGETHWEPSSTPQSLFPLGSPSGSWRTSGKLVVSLTGILF